jgi:uncharacterized membrane protein
VHPYREFPIIAREDCFVCDFDRAGFFEFDTGKDAKSSTVQLTGFDARSAKSLII